MTEVGEILFRKKIEREKERKERIKQNLKNKKYHTF